jgi:thymidylate kinase
MRMRTLPARTCAALEQAGIAYCVLRDADRLDQLAAEGGELDLLVSGGQMAALRRVLREQGFVSLPAWGHAPHHFFLAYDAEAGVWCKVDAVTRLVYEGWLPTDLGTACLAHRRRAGEIFVPAPEEELIALLLHAVLDKGRFAPQRAERLHALRQAITDPARMNALLERYWSPNMDWEALAALLEGGVWDDLLAQRDAVRAHLARHAPQVARLGHVRRRFERGIGRLAGLLRAPVLPAVALLGPDGAGKSSLTGKLREQFALPVTPVYMGLYQKGATRSGALDRLPGLRFARLLLTQWRRYMRARMAQARGHLVLFDRYPYDALLNTGRARGTLKRVRRWLLAHACPPPDLVLVLDAPGPTLYARKGEHSPEALEEQRQAYRALAARLPQARLIDTSGDPAQSARQASVALWETLQARHGLARRNA